MARACTSRRGGLHRQVGGGARSPGAALAPGGAGGRLPAGRPCRGATRRRPRLRPRPARRARRGRADVRRVRRRDLRRRARRPGRGAGPHRRRATTRSPSRATPWWSSAATTPTSARRRSSPSTPGSPPTSARRCCSCSTATAAASTSCARQPTMAQAELTANHGTLFAIIANRVDPRPPSGRAAALAADGVPAFALPEQPLLSAPSVGDLMAACDGTPGQRRRERCWRGRSPASWSRR